MTSLSPEFLQHLLQGHSISNIQQMIQLNGEILAKNKNTQKQHLETQGV